MSCVAQSTGQIQFKVYDSMMSLSSDLQVARALVVVDIVVGIAGLFMVFVGGKCTNFLLEEVAKARATVAVGVVLIISGILCLIPVSSTASLIIQDFYNRLLVDAQMRELGGWDPATPGRGTPLW